MGAVFEVPVARAAGVADLPGVKVALVAGAGRPLAEVWEITPVEVQKSPTTLLVGSEREGLPPELVAAADVTAHIPIQTHSLNAAMAATVALYEITRMARA
jgi:TrmH family RNA methyltransferase